ncbi:MAG TPA: hypothetical protein VHX88_18260 [Solirubrobacteraceae bacterium]|jgi:hypothetical protein|nr:hypothetical protein [Solirubrobacteraceae bacterium]
MTDALAAMDFKVHRARTLIVELDRMITGNLASDRYRFEKSLEPGESRLTYRVHDVPTPDLEWSIRIGEILHQLRSTLDHLAWQLVLLDGTQPNRQTQFPILDCPPAATTDLLRQVADPEILSLVDACQPYAGGAGGPVSPSQAHGQPLWVLRCLNNIDKHRLLLVTLCVLDLDRVYWGGPPAPDPYLNTAGLTEGAVAARFDFHDQTPPPGFDPHLSLKIVINESEAPSIRHAEVCSILRNICNYVEWDVVDPMRALFDRR